MTFATVKIGFTFIQTFFTFFKIFIIRQIVTKMLNGIHQDIKRCGMNTKTKVKA